jgi:RNA polymerase sigma factor (TIGR02999 family)
MRHTSASSLPVSESSPASSAEITVLLQRWQAGEETVLDELLPLVYQDLRQLAASQLRGHPGHHTLQPTALVNDLMLRLLGAKQLNFASRKHFFVTAARLMAQVLIDRARAMQRDKRGGDWQRSAFTDALALPIEADTEILALHEAIEALATEDQDLADLVRLRYFIGLEVSEVAQLQGVDERTVYRDWAFARAWLRTRMELPA